MEQSLVTQRPLERRLHLHRTQLLNGEVQVRLGLGPLFRVVIKQQLREGEAGHHDLGPETDTLAKLNCPQVVGTGLVRFTQKHGRGTKMAGHTAVRKGSGSPGGRSSMGSRSRISETRRATSAAPVPRSARNPSGSRART